MSFAKNMGKNLINRYSQELSGSVKKSTTDAVKTASKWAIQKTVETVDDLIGNKSADQITSVSKNSLRHSQYDDANNETEVTKERYI